MANKKDWTILLNPSYLQQTKNSKDFEQFLKQVRYKDKVSVHIEGSWIEGEIRGFNHKRVYIFNEHNKMSEHEWQQLEFIKKQCSEEIIEYVYPEQKVNIIAVVFMILIFICTFLLGIFYSYIPELFVK